MQYSIILGDIATIKADAIVNSSNASLQKGSGMCKTIYERAGERELSAYLKDCDSLPCGHAIVTPAFALPAKYIIHTVTPKYYLAQNDRSILLSQCYSAILQAAAFYQINTLAIPCLGVGHHGWPLAEAATIGVKTLQWRLEELNTPTALQKIIFVCHTQEQYAAYSKFIFPL
ncbi:MAG: macro domain-containing protein [Phascolarctobacterium sp.]|uniref:macro domain-containing protein n=1 Tax=Phascolarctobacterium sp. TaxID=2049039 RepID=UPI0026DAD9DC|nr:macro domain-containing protein [Phascolarctobacterium sp.]MDO4922201.1 macro domain-containing protein [Phascolarctobacterium sp.]